MESVNQDKIEMKRVKSLRGKQHTLSQTKYGKMASQALQRAAKYLKSQKSTLKYVEMLQSSPNELQV
jgi:hypothetical protein